MITEKYVQDAFYQECDKFCAANKKRSISESAFGEVASRAAKKIMPLIEQLQRDNESEKKVKEHEAFINEIEDTVRTLYGNPLGVTDLSNKISDYLHRPYNNLEK